MELHRSAHALAGHRVSNLSLEVTERGGCGLGRAEVDAMSEPASVHEATERGTARSAINLGRQVVSGPGLKLGFEHDLLSSLSSHPLGRRCIGLLATGVFSICVRTAWWRPEA